MLQYNAQGYLIPDRPITLDYDAFIKEFAFNEHRKAIIEHYEEFLHQLQGLNVGSFYQWIDGSFVTQKVKPGDMDVVSFIAAEQYTLQASGLRMLSHAFPNVDAYFVRVYPDEHPQNFITIFDQTESLHLFSTDRKRVKKGFIQLNF